MARKKRAMDKMGQVAKDDKLFPNHIDHSNPHTFETEDLKRLIKEATRDLEEQDKTRREEFKRYATRFDFPGDFFFWLSTLSF